MNYELACFKCGIKSNLSMLAHRIKEKSPIVGWLLVCEDCLEYITDHLLRIELVKLESWGEPNELKKKRFNI